MREFKKYDVWQLSHKLVLEVYKISKNFPKDELFNITSQLRRAVTSIPTNISEGCGRSSDKEFSHFLNIALGSASEAEYLVILSTDLQFIDAETSESLLKNINQIKSKIFNLKQKINPQ
ncbi:MULTISPECIES: four helix bundle protein [Capnocytophaga]|uniref:S23 ribosomal protein n=1 Tax=Capnocytophaga cynodegmi TaxID=28189 RepID=A0A0B7HB56_9FLAO|nr:MULTISPECIES: four helix bundle protein [Capnocytophaga]ATA75139.1 four helix bundle protein [Capnocytophaga sp. H2931]CEN35943.1 S23 ribosomal protein [Capnocytophaga cynodegmi]CEN36555.1 S23 ribosomal protein [Capnocytophaga cynodegmi]CEN45736.1 S23 ribosomal protein [Capnocytophaga canis]